MRYNEKGRRFVGRTIRASAHIQSYNIVGLWPLSHAVSLILERTTFMETRGRPNCRAHTWAKNKPFQTNTQAHSNTTQPTDADNSWWWVYIGPVIFHMMSVEPWITPNTYRMQCTTTTHTDFGTGTLAEPAWSGSGHGSGHGSGGGRVHGVVLTHPTTTTTTTTTTILAS